MSLRRRVALSLLAVALVLVGAGVVLATTMHDFLVERVDSQLDTLSPRAVVTPTPRQGNGPGGGGVGGGGLGGGGPRVVQALPQIADVYVADVTRQGVVTIRQSGTLTDPPDFARLARDLADEAVAYPVLRTIPAQNGSTDYRVHVNAVPSVGYVMLAVSLDETDRTYARIVLVDVVASLSVLLVLGLVAYWLLHHGVRPLADVARVAEAIAGGDLSHRVAITNEHTEVGRMSLAVNRMLGEIEQSFAEKEATEQRLKRFVADASHELRTPLTSIRGYAELWQHGALSDPADFAAAMSRLKSEGERMTRLVEDLLTLAKFDEAPDLRLGRVDMAAIVRDAAADARAVDPSRPVTVEATGAAPVEGDEDRLRQVVANLVFNALTHTPAGTPLHLVVEADAATVVVKVIDDGPGLAPELAARVFDRFVRGDTSRTRANGGSGLGLSVVRSVVEAHGGVVSLHTEPGAGCAFTVVLRAAPAPEPSAVSWAAPDRDR